MYRLVDRYVLKKKKSVFSQSSVVHRGGRPVDELRDGRQSVSAPSHMRSSRTQSHSQIWFYRRVSTVILNVSIFLNLDCAHNK